MNYSDYISFYNAHTDFTPYGYQIKVAEYLFAGKNVILSVPTGAGKTWASIMPFLYARNNPDVNFPQKMIYSLPLRALTNSIYEDVSEIVENTSIQTGEYSDDAFFEEGIVFSTIDQTLSNFLCFPLSLSRRQANINAGALVGSYLIFDEFHLLDTKLSMATSLGVIRLLEKLSRVCIMTATLTDDYLDFIKRNFNFEIVSIKDFPEDVDKIKSLKPKPDKSVKKSIHVVSDKKLNADSILQHHTNKTIVICNRVEHAQKIFNELKEKKSAKTELLCIHSRFFHSDRKRIEQQIKTHFGKGSKSEDYILVATQVIEAGMDISCDTMHTEVSPVNSFLQRAGRCARFEDEYGEVFIYDVLDLEEKEKLHVETDNKDDEAEIRALNNRYLPYDKDICRKTLDVLPKYSFLNEEIAISLVNEVLGEQEQFFIDQMKELNYNIGKIENSWLSCNKNMYRETIRDIQSIDIILIDIEAYKNRNIVPWQFETISVFRWSFISWAKKIETGKFDPDNDRIFAKAEQRDLHDRDTDDWIFAKAELANNSVFDFDWEDKGAFVLKKLAVEEIKNYYEYPVFVDVRYFGYANDAGLMTVPNEENNVSPEKQQKEKEDNITTYKKDTYYQHNKGLLNCYEIEFKPRLNYLFAVLNEYWGVATDWNKLIQLILCMHDYGKLNKLWQKPMHEFQKRKSEEKGFTYNPNEFLAHTDYDDDTDKELAKVCRLKSKPSHAGIGAVVVYELLYDLYGEELARAVSTAILKHHSPDSKSFDSFNVTERGVDEAKRLCKEIGIHGNLIHKGRGAGLEDTLPDISNKKEWITCFMFVRILRICDQKATGNLEKYYQYECV